MKININGFGRIGRAIFRVCSLRDDINITHINDINPSIENLAYLLKYDSIYGKYEGDVTVKGEKLIVNGAEIKVTHEPEINNVKWESCSADILVDSSGVVANHGVANHLIKGSIKKVIITHSSKKVDQTLILGVNERMYNKNKDHVISSSICDTNAIAPVLKLLNDSWGIVNGNVTTLHPWLGYQNLSDAACRSFAYPGEISENFSLGRASTETLMPKSTSCIDATIDVIPELEGKLISMSFRVPTPIVSCAVININLKKTINISNVIEVLNDKVSSQKYNIISISDEPLISKDYLKNSFSAIIDNRWTTVDNKNGVRLVIWYDNEWGYSSRVVDLIDSVLL